MSNTPNTNTTNPSQISNTSNSTSINDPNDEPTMPPIPTLPNAKDWHHSINFKQRSSIYNLIWKKVLEYYEKYPGVTSLTLRSDFANGFTIVWNRSEKKEEFTLNLKNLSSSLGTKYRRIFFEKFLDKNRDVIRRIAEEYRDAELIQEYTLFSKLYAFIEHRKLQNEKIAEEVYKILDSVRDIIETSVDLIPKQDIFLIEQERKRILLEEEERKNAKRMKEEKEKLRKKQEIERKQRERLEATKKREEQERQRRIQHQTRKFPLSSAVRDVFLYYGWNNPDALFSSLRLLSQQTVDPQLDLELSKILNSDQSQTRNQIYNQTQFTHTQSITNANFNTNTNEIQQLIQYMEERNNHFQRISETDFIFDNGYLQGIIPRRKIIVRLLPICKELVFGNVSRNFQLYEWIEGENNHNLNAKINSNSNLYSNHEEINPPNNLTSLKAAIDFYIERIGRIDELRLEMQAIGDTLIPKTGLKIVRTMNISYDSKLSYVSFFIQFNFDHPDINIIVDLNDGNVLRVMSDINNPKNQIEVTMHDLISSVTPGAIITKLHEIVSQ